MSMNQAPQSVRTRIALFGRTNVGKSSLINRMTNQQVSIVSEQSGTTTDPVKKSMELLPLGPVLLIDTAGLDDQSELGRLRIERAMKELAEADIVLLVAEAGRNVADEERAFLASPEVASKPLIIALNKADLPEGGTGLSSWRSIAKERGAPLILVSSVTGEGVDQLKQVLAEMKPNLPERPLIRDLVPPGETCILVVPIDSGAPKGRLILPQQQVIRDLLEGGALPLITRDTDYPAALLSLKKPPVLVVTDSQVFGRISKQTPDELPLTSFSMLFARFKGDLHMLSEGAKAVDALQDGDRVLIAEGCTHHRQCEDIGTVKIPAWLQAHTKKSLRLSFSSGTGFPEDLPGYKLIIHCGGCMLTQQQMELRMEAARRANVPMVNYGVFIAHINGILSRCLKPLL